MPSPLRRLFSVAMHLSLTATGRSTRRSRSPRPSDGVYVSTAEAHLPHLLAKTSVEVTSTDDEGVTYVDLMFYFKHGSIGILPGLELRQPYIGISSNEMGPLRRYIGDHCYSLGTKHDLWKFQVNAPGFVLFFKPEYTHICVDESSYRDGVYWRANLLLGRLKGGKEIQYFIPMVFDEPRASSGDLQKLGALFDHSYSARPQEEPSGMVEGNGEGSVESRGHPLQSQPDAPTEIERGSQRGPGTSAEFQSASRFPQLHKLLRTEEMEGLTEASRADGQKAVQDREHPSHGQPDGATSDSPGAQAKRALEISGGRGRQTSRKSSNPQHLVPISEMGKYLRTASSTAVQMSEHE
ncbi:hypothetical protein FOZ63_029426 [Perkinsus olseni]|uniref:Uncharacterized protein n=1 Tax=Perkinsus olseni TaxID=32597 RepID=A0A7J6TH65_PEROL|nr:hypothetical protein FOZ62_027693 [Perkinsus olseni]KAF4749563.1 hypothetical protein FOZ63_029426 [Perkinsus olseni]